MHLATLRCIFELKRLWYPDERNPMLFEFGVEGHLGYLVVGINFSVDPKYSIGLEREEAIEEGSGFLFFVVISAV